MSGSHWIPARPEMYVQTGSMLENPYGVPHDEIRRFILENPPEVVAQVVFGQYVESSGLVFTGELVRNLFDRSLPRVSSNTYLDDAAVEEGRLERLHYGDLSSPRFACGVDLARRTDWTVIFVLDTKGAPERPARVVYFRRLQRVPWESIYAEIGLACHLFGATALCDSTGVGDVVCEELEGRRYCPDHHLAIGWNERCRDHMGEPLACLTASYSPIGVERFVFNAGSKYQLVTHLAQALGWGYDPDQAGKPFGLLRAPSVVQLADELAFYAWEDKKLVTDCVMALALAAWQGVRDMPAAPVSGSVVAA